MQRRARAARVIEPDAAVRIVERDVVRHHQSRAVEPQVIFRKCRRIRAERFLARDPAVEVRLAAHVGDAMEIRVCRVERDCIHLRLVRRVAVAIYLELAAAGQLGVEVKRPLLRSRVEPERVVPDWRKVEVAVDRHVARCGHPPVGFVYAPRVRHVAALRVVGALEGDADPREDKLATGERVDGAPVRRAEHPPVDDVGVPGRRRHGLLVCVAPVVLPREGRERGCVDHV